MIEELIGAPRGAERFALRGLGVVAALSLGIIVVLTFVDVFARYILAQPIRGSSEIIQFAMAVTIFAALPIVTFTREHISVSLIENLLKGRVRWIQMLLVQLVSAAVLATVAILLFLQGQQLESRSMSTNVLGWPMGPLAYLIGALAGLATILTLCRVVAHVAEVLRESRSLSDRRD